MQHLLTQQGPGVYAALAGGGGSIFVCGDGAHMAKAVHAVLIDLFCAHGGLAANDAAAQLAAMTTERRYVRDVWS